MKLHLVFLSVLALALSLTGCSGIAAALDVTQYAAGTYSGPYVSKDGAHRGTVTFTVGKEGDISGTGHSDTLNADFTIAAHLANTGRIRGSFIVNGNADPIEGNLEYNDGRLSGDLTQTLDDGTKLILDFQLRKE